MAFSRYQDREKKVTPLSDYREQNSEDQEIATHYVSPENKLDKSKLNFPYFEYKWKHGDKLYKISQKNLGDPKLWWVIAHINMKPTDGHYQPGDTLIIPERKALTQVIEMLGY